METVNILDKPCTAGGLILEAVAEAGVAKLVADKTSHTAMKDARGKVICPVTVKCFVEGEEVDLIGSLDNLLKRLEAYTEESIEKKAAEKAVKMITDAGLSDLANDLADIRFEVIDKIRAAGFKIRDEDHY